MHNVLYNITVYSYVLSTINAIYINNDQVMVILIKKITTRYKVLSITIFKIYKLKCSLAGKTWCCPECIGPNIQVIRDPAFNRVDT